LNLKFLNELAASNDRNFKFTALDVGCVVANYQNVTVTSHTYEYCAAGAFVRAAFLAAKHSGCTKVGQLHFIFSDACTFRNYGQLLMLNARLARSLYRWSWLNSS
jgi:hypothetical protein